ncbi:MAG: hypothetical protein RMN25_04520 [Anaerolineae bacterium]|nr:hypothetical protein [Thermoflexales bacterium]MDW8407027.1 hypothetical protein [Anaerolineae bacterium]
MSDITPVASKSEETFCAAVSCADDARAAGDRLFTGSLAFVALRCTVRYIVLPFLLPLAGLSGGLSAVIALVIDAVALTTIFLNVRRLWNTSWRWRYAGLAVVMTVIIAILAWGDLQTLIG